MTRLVKRHEAIVLLECGHWVQTPIPADDVRALLQERFGGCYPDGPYYCNDHGRPSPIARDEIDDTPAILTMWDYPYGDRKGTHK